jgi:hypothetical protein
MARNRAGPGASSSGPAVATATTKAPPGRASDPAKPAAAPDTNAGKKPQADGTPRPDATAAPATAGKAAGPQAVVVHIEVICGGITNVKVPVTISPHYRGLPLAGVTRAFDHQLDFWLTRTREQGMIGFGLGKIFPMNLQRQHDAGKVKVEHLLLASMGDPGYFATDDLRFVMSNVVVAVKSMGHDHISTPLIGTYRGELPIGQAVHGFLEGILDGYERFRAIANAVTDERERFQQAARSPLFVALVEADEKKATQIYEAFKEVQGDNENDQASLTAVEETGGNGSTLRLQLEVARGDTVDKDPEREPSAVNLDPDVKVTLLRVTRKAPAPATTTPPNPTAVVPSNTETFQFSALSEVAAVTVREVDVSSYLLRELPNRMIGASSSEEREAFGTFFANYLIPDDFRKLTEGSINLTLVVDETTAAYPWEMAAHKKYSKTIFVGTSLSLSRQFRTLLSPPPSSLPPLNRELKALVIADPAPGTLSLPHAREEGLAVVDVMDRARRAWQGEYTFKVTVRIGSHHDPEDPRLETVRRYGNWIVNAKPCDPLELALLIVNEQFDVIHYAGHGEFDRNARRAGWILDRDCFLSAQEIFRVRRVPRLVFANACFSAVTEPTDHREQRGKLVGLAQAFFERGIPNYIGTGWAVDDACALLCAQWFYTRILGLRRPANGDAVIGTLPLGPATIGESLLEARQQALKNKTDSSTWGAYQHYGRVSDKLLPRPNASGPPKVGGNL